MRILCAIIVLLACNPAAIASETQPEPTSPGAPSQLPRGLQADEVLQFGGRGAGTLAPQGPTHLSVIEEGRKT